VDCQPGFCVSGRNERANRRRIPYSWLSTEFRFDKRREAHLIYNTKTCRVYGRTNCSYQPKDHVQRGITVPTSVTVRELSRSTLSVQSRMERLGHKSPVGG
jgi:hypothetical protein